MERVTFSLLPVSGPNIANLGFPFRTTKDASGVVHGDGEAGKLYRYRLLIDGRRAGVASYNGRVRNYLSTFGTPGALPIIDWHKVLFRPATPEEIATGTALPALQASVTENSLAIVDLENQQALAAYELIANASGGERVVPIHAMLIDLGFMDFVRQRKRVGETKLFAEVGMGATGYRSTTFSAWFRRFLVKAGAAAPKTCFHSFRHGFRDALREARIDRDIALALGGWTAGNGSAAVSDAYGNGYQIATLKEAIDRVQYPSLDLSHLNNGDFRHPIARPKSHVRARPSCSSENAQNAPAAVHRTQISRLGL